MFLECKANGDRLSTCAYNAAIRCVPNKSGLSTSWLEMVGLLSEMKEAGAAPSQSTLIALLRWLRSFGEKDYAASCDHALSVVAELRAAGIQVKQGLSGANLRSCRTKTIFLPLPPSTFTA